MIVALSLVVGLLFVPSPTAESFAPHLQPSAVEVELLTQLKNGAPPLEYWDSVAKCETRNDWQNGGTWGGGLGIYNVGNFHSEKRGTWERWGGEQFAPQPQRATKTEQIVVANRIAMFGFKTWKYRDPKIAKRKGVPVKYWYDKAPTGYWGWGCIRETVGNPCGVKKNGQRGTYRPKQTLVGSRYYKQHCQK